MHHIDWYILDDLEQCPIIIEFDEPMKMEELKIAIKNERRENNF